MSKIDLQPFCDTEDEFFTISKPFVRKGHRYATDSRIIVRVPCEETDTPIEKNARYPKCEALFDNHFPAAGFKPLGDSISATQPHPDKYMRPCACCRDVPCFKCLGSKTMECYACGQDCDCEYCDGCGKAFEKHPDCTVCDENGEVPVMIYRIGDAWFHGDFIDKIRALPSVLVAQCGDGNSKMLAFRFDGGQGLLMCMNID